MARKVLAVLTGAETAEVVLEAARLIAGRMGTADIEALHVRHDPLDGFMPTEEVMMPGREQALDEAEAKLSAAVRAVFDRWVKARAAGLVPLWREVTGPVERAVAERASKADLVVVGREREERDPDLSGVLHVLLFGTGVPILLAPPAPPRSVGRHPAVAWKNAGPAERAMEAALPILLKAERVTVLLGDAKAEEDSVPSSATEALRAAAVPLEVRRFESGARAIGAALLAEAHECGADLLVMGAFAHSRIRELILGGATREVLHGADMAVLMRH